MKLNDFHIQRVTMISQILSLRVWGSCRDRRNEVMQNSTMHQLSYGWAHGAAYLCIQSCNFPLNIFWSFYGPSPGEKEIWVFRRKILIERMIFNKKLHIFWNSYNILFKCRYIYIVTYIKIILFADRPHKKYT